jgi:hypothetical protein
MNGEQVVNMMERSPHLTRLKWIVLVAVSLVMACAAPVATPTSVPPAVAPTAISPSTPRSAEKESEGDLSDEQIATLDSLEQVDDHPLYTMVNYGEYAEATSVPELVEQPVDPTRPKPSVVPSAGDWACSLFAALGDGDGMLYGRNFDWEYSPALLLFTDPPDGYASASMVDIAYLGFGGAEAQGLTDLPLAEREGMLRAPFLPFDGFNEQGLAIGMAAVPPGNVHPDPDKETLGSLMVMREILDHASNVDEAVVILQNHNVDMGGGPPLHYLVADASGRAALVEFYQGDVVVMVNEDPWHLATNFLCAAAGDSTEGTCWRYDKISERLEEAQGRLSAEDGLALLADVSQDGTQWSIVYGLSIGDVTVAMGRQYEVIHTFHLDPAGS